MNSFEYVVYYEYNGPSACDPLRSPKDSHEVLRALRDFPSALQHHLSGGDPPPESKPRDAKSITVRVNTALDETAADAAVKYGLKSLDLFGRKLEQA